MRVLKLFAVLVCLVVPTFAQNPAIDTAADETIRQANEIKRLNHLVTPPPPPPAALALTCPVAQAVTSTSGSMSVTFPAPMTSGGVPPIAVVLSQASGSAFPVGVTTVTATATDAASQKQMCGFSITVTAVAPPPPPPPPPPPTSGAPPGATTLVWSTDFNRSTDWNAKSGQATGLPGVSAYGSWSTSGHPNGEEITLAANKPGSLGRGQRHWTGPGTNSNSGSLSIDFGQVLSNLWVRWSMRYQTGLSFSQYHKLIYVAVTTPQAVIPEFHYGGVNIWTNSGANHEASSSGGFASCGGSSGNWIEMIVHLKSNTTSANGIGEMWCNGVQVLNERAVNYGGASWRSFLTLENMAIRSGSGDMCVDLDDLSVWK